MKQIIDKPLTRSHVPSTLSIIQGIASARLILHKPAINEEQLLSRPILDDNNDRSALVEIAIPTGIQPRKQHT
jgi:hypothetical protein